MDMLNFDRVKEPEIKHHFLLPDCHYMMVGQTGCGKTNTLCNMLIQSWLKADKVVIYTINPEQSKYQLLSELYNNSLDGSLVLSSPDDVEPVEMLENELHKVIIFDDIKIDKKNMDRIKEYFSLSRNRKCNCVYLCQSYYDVPKYIRRNTKCFLLYKGLDNRDVISIAHDHSPPAIKKEFPAIYNSATALPYSFLTFDKTSNHLPQMLRRGFDEFYSG